MLALRRGSRSAVAIVASLFLEGACATGEDVPDDKRRRDGDAGDASLDVAETAAGGTGGTSVSTGGTGGGSAGAGGGAAGSSGGAPDAAPRDVSTSDVTDASTAGAGGSGGSAGTGTGGAAGIGGAGGIGDSGSSCPPGQKLCGGLCIVANANNGCTVVDGQCTACPAVTSGTTKCTASQCDFDCDQGYVKNGSICERQCTVTITCASLGLECGSNVDDGCGGVLDCRDNCILPHTCGGGGVPEQCGCNGCCPPGSGEEQCNGVDDDRDGLVDEPSSINAGTCNGCVILEDAGSVYWFCTMTSSYDNAESFCVGKGGHLATINDQVENDFVRGNMAAGSFWIGYDSLNGSNGTCGLLGGCGGWAWRAGPSSFRFFDCNAGTSRNDCQERCAVVNQATGCWDDRDCQNRCLGGNESNPFVCEATTNQTTCDSVMDGG